MKWITLERPKIDRIVCPWLVLRCIDPEAEFLYVPPADVLRLAAETGAIPHDIPGVALSHEGELCSFDAFLKKYGLTDPALQQLAAQAVTGIRVAESSLWSRHARLPSLAAVRGSQGAAVLGW